MLLQAALNLSSTGTPVKSTGTEKKQEYQEVDINNHTQLVRNSSKNSMG